VSVALIDGFLIGETNFYAGGGGQKFSNLNVKFSSDEMLSFFFKKMKEEILKIKDINEKNFNLAVTLKNEGTLYDYRKEVRGINKTERDPLFKEAIQYYLKLPGEYLNQQIPVASSTGSDIMNKPRKFLFLYPDYRVPFQPFEPRSLEMFVSSPAFIKYVLDNNLFNTLYQSADELKYFELWLGDYHVVMSSGDVFLKNRVPPALMDRLASKLEAQKANQSADLNILYLHLANNAFDQKQAYKGFAYLNHVQLDKLLNEFQYKNFNFVNTYSLELVGKAMADLTVSNHFDLAYKFVNVFKKEVNRSSLYAYASQLISLSQEHSELAKRLLDSAQAEMNRLDNPAVFQPNRQQVAIALMYIDPEKNSEEAYRTIKNSFNKFAAIVGFSKAHALYGNLYQAQQQVPPLISSGDKAAFFRNILDGYNLRQANKNEWKKFKANEFIFTRIFLPYVNENQ
jgi:hypothetical protein